MEYNFNEIERRWQQRWAEMKTYHVAEDKTKEKFYVLNMFPYPSGAGLHVGHPLGYIASDIYARYKRMKGFNVLNPMGYDAYGLPAEQYAIQTGQHPAVTTEENINHYREQLDKIGFSFDWDREVRTCDPGYYKWTQWAFQKMFESYYDNTLQKARPIAELVKHLEQHGTEGLNAAQTEQLDLTADEWRAMSEKEQQQALMNWRLAYLGETMVNWCAGLGTVLANDEVVDGVSVRGGYPVVQKKMMQWCLRVSAYAQRLLDGLDTVDWTDSLKETQRNWIGRSEGTEIVFKIAKAPSNSPCGGEQATQEGDNKANISSPTGGEQATQEGDNKANEGDNKANISSPTGGVEGAFTIFTTRADTIFGVTFMVLAPESELVPLVTTEERKADVDAYLERTKKRTERERISDRSVSGVFTGSYAVNPFTGEDIPIWISDYVLAGYGTGAIMAVPAHDSRDYAFARHFGLEIRPLIEGCDVSEESFDAKEGIVCNSPAPSISPCRGEQVTQEVIEKQWAAFKTANPFNYEILKENAKNNRNNPTDAETALWEALRNNQLGEKFRRQHIVGDFIVDFISLKSHLIIEADGKYHDTPEQEEADKLRTIFLNKTGFKVLRFTNEEILGNINVVISKIKEEISHANQSSPTGGVVGAFSLNGLSVKEAIQKTKEFVKEHNLGRMKVNYRLRDAIFSRQRYWGEPFPVYYKDGMPYMIPEECLPLELPEIDQYKPTETGEPPLGHAKKWAWDTENNCVVDKQLVDNKTVFPLELNTMPGFAGSSAYYLRYMDPKDDQALVSPEADRYWRNVDLYVGGTEHATGHLIYSRFWNKFLFDLGVSCEEEPFKKLVNQGMIQGRSNFVYRVNSPLNSPRGGASDTQDSGETTNKANQSLPTGEVGGAGAPVFVSYGLKDKYDTTPIHVDVNIVHGDVLDVEAFKAWRPEYEHAEFVLEDGKYVCGWAIEKMSKSMYNVVNPDMIVERYGADTLRLYEMFLGPVEQSKPWDTNGIDGCHRFLKKFWALYAGKDGLNTLDDGEPAADEMKSLHKLIKKVTGDIETFSYNTSVAAFMICVGELAQMKCRNRKVLTELVKLIAPFAPHMAEELWHTALGQDTTVCDAAWPEFDEKYLVETTVQLTVSFNGKARFQMQFPADADNKAIEDAVMADERSKKYIGDKHVVKVIIVPKKIVNIVVK